MKKRIREEYKLLGRLHRATWPKKFWEECQFNKFQMLIRRIRSFLDTPKCICPKLCTIHYP